MIFKEIEKVRELILGFASRSHDWLDRDAEDRYLTQRGILDVRTGDPVSLLASLKEMWRVDSADMDWLLSRSSAWRCIQSQMTVASLRILS